MLALVERGGWHVQTGPVDALRLVPLTVLQRHVRPQRCQHDDARCGDGGGNDERLDVFRLELFQKDVGGDDAACVGSEVHHAGSEGFRVFLGRVVLDETRVSGGARGVVSPLPQTAGDEAPRGDEKGAEVSDFVIAHWGNGEDDRADDHERCG